MSGSIDTSQFTPLDLPSTTLRRAMITIAARVTRDLPHATRAQQRAETRLRLQQLGLLPDPHALRRDPFYENKTVRPHP